MKLRDNLLLEKASKSDISIALKNPNVRIGAEFEFLFNNKDFLKKHGESLNNHDRMLKMEAEFDEYDDALELWSETDLSKPPPKVPEWASDYSDGDEIPEPSELFPYMKVNGDKIWMKLVNDYLKDEKKFPLHKNDYIITADHTTKSSSKWIIKPDGSLGMTGVEIVTPVLTIDEFLEYTPKMFKFIDGLPGAVINNKCGFHISISLINIEDLSKSLDVTKLSLFLDEGYIYNFFKKREFNDFAKSAFSTITSNMIKSNNPELIKNMIDTGYIEEKLEDDIKREYPESHYMAINIEHLKSSNKYIEFRYIGSKDYHLKWDKIKSVAANYIYALSVSCDPTYKRNEYYSKLSRLTHKIQFLSTVVEMNRMIQSGEITNKTNKKWLDLYKIWESLYVYKKAIDDDKKSTAAKRGFNNLCKILKINPDKLEWDFETYEL